MANGKFVDCADIKEEYLISKGMGKGLSATFLAINMWRSKQSG